MNSFWKATTQSVQKAAIVPTCVKLYLSFLLSEFTKLSFFIFSAVLHLCHICSPRLIQPYMVFVNDDAADKNINHRSSSKSNTDAQMLGLHRMKQVENENSNNVEGTVRVEGGRVNAKKEDDALLDSTASSPIQHCNKVGGIDNDKVPPSFTSNSKTTTLTLPTTLNEKEVLIPEETDQGRRLSIPLSSCNANDNLSRQKGSRPPDKPQEVKRDDRTLCEMESGSKKKELDTVPPLSKENELKVSELLRIRNEALEKLTWMQTEFRLIKQHSYRYRRTLQRQLQEEEILLQTIENTMLPKNLAGCASSTLSPTKNEIFSNPDNLSDDTFSFDVIKEKERKDGGKLNLSKKFPERSTPFSKALAAARTVESAAFFLRKQLCLSLMAPLEIEARLEAYERYKELLPKVAGIEKSCRTAVHKIVDEEELIPYKYDLRDVSEAMAFVDDDLTKQISPIAKSYKVISEMAKQSVVNRTEMLLLACSEFIVIHWDLLQSMSTNENSRMTCSVHELSEEALSAAAHVIVQNMGNSHVNCARRE